MSNAAASRITDLFASCLPLPVPQGVAGKAAHPATPSDDDVDEHKGAQGTGIGKAYPPPSGIRLPTKLVLPPRLKLKLPSSSLAASSSKELPSNQPNAPESVAQEHPAVSAWRQGLLGVSFSGGGFLLPYHFGVLDALKSLGIVTPGVTPMAGASAGAQAAASFHCGMDPMRQGLPCVLQLAAACRKEGTKGNLDRLLRQYLPLWMAPYDDIHMRCSGVTAIAICRVLPVMHTVKVTHFTSPQDLCDALAASCFLPRYSGALTTTFRGSSVVDGGVIELIPGIPRSLWLRKHLAMGSMPPAISLTATTTTNTTTTTAVNGTAADQVTSRTLCRAQTMPAKREASRASSGQQDDDFDDGITHFGSNMLGGTTHGQPAAGNFNAQAANGAMLSVAAKSSASTATAVLRNSTITIATTTAVSADSTCSLTTPMTHSPGGSMGGATITTSSTTSPGTINSSGTLSSSAALATPASSPATPSSSTLSPTSAASTSPSATTPASITNVHSATHVNHLDLNGRDAQHASAAANMPHMADRSTHVPCAAGDRRGTRDADGGHHLPAGAPVAPAAATSQPGSAAAPTTAVTGMSAEGFAATAVQQLLQRIPSRPTRLFARLASVKETRSNTEQLAATTSISAITTTSTMKVVKGYTVLVSCFPEHHLDSLPLLNRRRLRKGVDISPGAPWPYSVHQTFLLSIHPAGEAFLKWLAEQGRQDALAWSHRVGLAQAAAAAKAATAAAASSTDAPAVAVAASLVPSSDAAACSSHGSTADHHATVTAMPGVHAAGDDHASAGVPTVAAAAASGRRLQTLVSMQPAKVLQSGVADAASGRSAIEGGSGAAMHQPGLASSTLAATSAAARELAQHAIPSSSTMNVQRQQQQQQQGEAQVVHHHQHMAVAAADAHEAFRLPKEHDGDVNALTLLHRLLW